MNATFYSWPRGVGASAPDVGTESSERSEMSADLEIISDIRAGAVAMRARAPKYLPQYAQESDVEYARRVASAPWRAEFVDALHSLASKPFSKPVSFPDGTLMRSRPSVRTSTGAAILCTFSRVRSSSRPLRTGCMGFW
jgi:hypothetical protein